MAYVVTHCTQIPVAGWVWLRNQNSVHSVTSALQGPSLIYPQDDHMIRDQSHMTFFARKYSMDFEDPARTQTIQLVSEDRYGQFVFREMPPHITKYKTHTHIPIFTSIIDSQDVSEFAHTCLKREI
jgi:hypothetical protein